jgi:hypothetical protein
VGSRGLSWQETVSGERSRFTRSDRNASAVDTNDGCPCQKVDPVVTRRIPDLDLSVVRVDLAPPRESMSPRAHWIKLPGRRRRRDLSDIRCLRVVVVAERA